MCVTLESILPFFDEFFPLLNIFANDAANDGFSATISATFVITDLPDFCALRCHNRCPSYS
jgi:hypothetical protein